MGVLNLPKEALVGLVGGLFIFLFMIHFLLQIVIFVKFAEHKKGKRQWERLLPEKSKVDVVIGELRSLQNKINSIEKVTTEKRISWSQKLNDVSDSITKGIWLNKISIDGKMLLIDGSAVSKAKDEMTSVGNFASNLKNKSTFISGLQNFELGSIQRRQLKNVDLVDFVITAKLQ